MSESTRKWPMKSRMKVSPADTPTPTQRADNFVHFYTNNVQVGFSNWDMWIVFSELTDQERQETIVQEKAKVVMSLSHAKVLAEILTNGIKRFEEQFGEIQVIMRTSSQSSVGERHSPSGESSVSPSRKARQ